LSRVLKLMKFSTMAKSLEDFYIRMMVEHPGFIFGLELMNLLFRGALIVHYVACGFWAVSGRKDDPDDSWEADFEDRPVGSQYLYSLYFVVTTMSTVGYGDVTAKTDAERAYAMFAMVLGGSFYGILIAKITNALAQKEAESRAYYLRLHEIASFIHKNTFPPELSHKLIQYYQTFLNSQTLVDESIILKELNTSLRLEVIGGLLDVAVVNGPLFSPEWIGPMFKKLIEIMRKQCFDRGQFLTRIGQVADEMMIINAGDVVVFGRDNDVSDGEEKQGNPDLVPVSVAMPGAVLGACCALGLSKTFTVTTRALSKCEAYVIYEDDMLREAPRMAASLKDRLATFPDELARLENYGLCPVDTSIREALMVMAAECEPDNFQRVAKLKSTNSFGKEKINPDQAEVLNEILKRLGEIERRQIEFEKVLFEKK